jgi:4-methyl-5(b-hydroxyethyl)-thiazole monophosphate biosynthesis
MIYMFLAEGFEETEALAPLDLLRRADLSVTAVGVGGKEIKGAHGITVIADIDDSELMLDGEIDAVILPGGMPGTLNLDGCPAVHSALDAAEKSGAVIAAICAAPMILGKRGMLEGKEAICYPGFEEHLRGARISDKKVVRDGRFITAKGMGVANDFGLALVSALKSDALASKIKTAIMAD